MPPMSENPRIRLPNGSVCEARLGPDVDLEFEDIRDGRGKRFTEQDAEALLESRPSPDQPS